MDNKIFYICCTETGTPSIFKVFYDKQEAVDSAESMALREQTNICVYYCTAEPAITLEPTIVPVTKTELSFSKFTSP